MRENFCVAPSLTQVTNFVAPSPNSSDVAPLIGPLPHTLFFLPSLIKCLFLKEGLKNLMTIS